MTNREKVASALVLLWAALSVYLLFYFFSIPRNLLAFALAAGASALLGKKALACREKRVWLPCGLFAAFFSAALVVGRRVDEENAEFLGLSRADGVYWAVFTLYFCLLSAAVILWLREHPLPLGKAPLPEGRLGRALSWASWSGFIALCFLFYYFVFFPGLLTGDSFACLIRAMGLAKFNNQQPIVYQLLLSVFVRLGWLLGEDPASGQAGVALFSLFQLLCMAAMFGCCLYWLRRHGCPRPVLWGLAVFFGANPLHAMYAVTLWKDVMFGGFLMLLVLFLWDTAAEKGENLLRWQGILAFVLLSFAVSFFRNNGVYIFACVVVVMAVQLRARWKRVLPLLLAVSGAIYLIQGPLYTALNIGVGTPAESLAIPLQQIARVVDREGEITEEQREFLEPLLPLETVKEQYWAFTVDRIKFHEDFDDYYLATHLGEFFRTWAGMLGPNLKEYCVAYLMETAGYWRLGTTNWIVAPGIQGYSDTYGVEPANLTQRYLGADLQQPIQDWVACLQEGDFTGPLFNIASMVWLLFFLFPLLLAQKRGRELLCLLPLLLLWGTTMVAAPTYCELRYVYGLFTAAPAALWIALPKRGAQGLEEGKGEV